MLNPRPATLAVVGVVVLLVGVTAVGTADEGPLADGPVDPSTQQLDDPSGAEPADAPDDADSAPSADDPPAGKGGTADATDDDLSPTERTLEEMQGRDLSGAVDTYQDLGRRD